ncbi:MAG: sulfotransferase [Planctomycetia bacterium]|nr:sulfotransferase [Planctomycetia bacterium]
MTASSSAGAKPAQESFHAYPWWSPRFWHGMPLGVWLDLLREHGGRASPSRWGLVGTITAAAAFNSVAEPLAAARFRRRLAAAPATDPPLFIVGHWRSGTTLIHELMMLDERFCCPTTYQCFAPGHFLLTERFVTSALSWIMPAKRPMDDVAAGWHRPQEDEFALANMGSPSPYRRMAFPVTSPDRPEALDLAGLPPEALDVWKRNLRRFLATLAVRDPRRPVLKSPPHTARVGVLAGMFPGARFLHVVRDPFVVFPSTMRLWRSLHRSQALQVDRGEALEGYVFAAFDEMYAAFERDRATLAPGQLHEVRYEDLRTDPVARMREAYDRLGLGGFERVEPALAAQAASMRNYRTNRYDPDPRIVAEVARRWRPFIDRYGYRPPDVTAPSTSAARA